MKKLLKHIIAVVSNRYVSTDWEWIATEHNALATSFMTYCRKSVEGFGNGFSWCAVVRSRDTFRLNGWRMPIVQAIVNLGIVRESEGLNVHGGNTPSVDFFCNLKSEKR